MQDSNAATSAGGAGAGGRHREHQGTDRTTTTLVSSNAGVTHLHPLPPPRPSFSLPFPFFPSSSFFHARVWSRATKASAIGALSPTLFFFFPGAGCPLACRSRDTAKVPISRLAPRTPARPVLENAHLFLSVSHPRSRTRAPPDLHRLQRYLSSESPALTMQAVLLYFFG